MFFNMPPNNMIKAPPWFMGQMGVPGSDTPLGFRMTPRARDIYLDPGHPNASDANDGTDPNAPLLTMTGAVAKLLIANGGQNGDIIWVAPSAALTESVQILDYTLYASYCSIIGQGNTEFAPSWDSGLAANPCLVLGAVGWRVQGIRFYVPANAAAVVLPSTQPPYGGNAIGIRTKLYGNYFDGSVNTGLYGVDLHGAPYNVEIIGNKFAFMNGGASFCIVSTNTGLADAFRTVVAFNWFHESDNFIDASFNVSAIIGNWFSGQGVTSAAIKIDLRAGTRGYNTVSQNILDDPDYSNIGGYWANAATPGTWGANWHTDIAEAEVADNGLTILPPT